MKLKYEHIFDLFPEAQIETDNDGQIIIYTGMMEGDSDGGIYFMDKEEQEGVQLNRLERWPVTPKVVGSSPITLATQKKAPSC